MPIDPNIIAGLKPVQIQTPDPLEQYGKTLTLRNLMQQGDLGTLQYEHAQRAGESEKRLNALFANNANPTPEEVTAADPNFGIKYRRAALDAQKTQSEIAKNQQEVEVKALASHRDELANVKTPEDAAAWVMSGFKDPVLGPLAQRSGKTPDQVLATIPKDPQELQTWIQRNALGATKYIEANKPKVTTQNLGGTEQLVSTPGLGGAPSVLSSTPRTQSPDSAATDARAATEGALNRANHRLIAGIDATGKPVNSLPEGKIDLSSLPRVDLEAGYRYFVDGTLPPNMGRGQQGMAESRRIRGVASAIGESLGVSPEEVRANQLAFKGGGQALTQLVKREAQIGSNVRNFDFNADQVLDLSQKVDRTGIPVVNAWLNAGKRSVQGNPELSAFDVAVKTTVNEFAQIVSGTTAGATTEGEKQKAEKLLSAAQTPEQVTSVIHQMRIESQNRMKSFADQKRETLNSMRAGGKPKDAETPKPAAPAAPTGKPGASGIKFLGFE